MMNMLDLRACLVAARPRSVPLTPSQPFHEASNAHPDLITIHVFVELTSDQSPLYVGHFVRRHLPRGAFHGHHLVGHVRVTAVKSARNIKLELSVQDRCLAMLNVPLSELSFSCQSHAWAMGYRLISGFDEPDADDGWLLANSSRDRYLRAVFKDTYKRRVDACLKRGMSVPVAMPAYGPCMHPSGGRRRRRRRRRRWAAATT
jgi:hypothetical protein